MNTEKIINKVNITSEPVFDYEDCLELGKICKPNIKAEVEEYINNLNKSGRLIWED